VIPDEPGSPDHASHRPVKPRALPEDIQLVYADDHDRRRVVRLEEADSIDFGRTVSFRQPPAYRGQRNFPGWWWSATSHSHVVYESWLERHHIVEADRDPKIVLITGQPFELTWPVGKRRMRHTPDLFCRTLDGCGIVTDCRPVDKADEDFRYKCAVTAAACKEIGWEFRAVGDPDPVWAANLRWLSGYRHPRFADQVLEDRLLKALASPQSLADAAGLAGDPIRVMPVLFHLMWRGRLSADLSRPLGNNTVLVVSTDPLETA